MKQYLDLLKDVKENGVRKQDRTGTGTISVFGREFRHKMSDGFPLLTTKKMAYKQVVTELLWFLNGDTNIRFLVENNCHIWDGDAYKNFQTKRNREIELNTSMIFNSMYTDLSKEDFIENIKTDDRFAKMWGDLGPIYGKQWRDWGNATESQLEIVVEDGKIPYTQVLKKEINRIDQIHKLIDDLKSNPDSRRLMVSAWNVGEIEDMVLPPCHYGFQCYTTEMNKAERYHKWLEYVRINKVDETGMSSEQAMEHYRFAKRKLSIKFNMRSIDFPLGFPFNIASYGLLLEILAKEVNMISDELIATLGDTHIYLNQMDGVNEQLTREPYSLPKLFINKNKYIDNYTIEDFEIRDYTYHPVLKIPLSN